MSNRARIGVYNPRLKCIQSIYLHADGYVEYAGRMLLEHYNSYERALELIQLGNLSKLAPSTQCPPGHSFEYNIRGYCVAYFRDRAGYNQHDDDYIRTTDITRFKKSSWRVDHCYLFYNNKWFLFTNKKMSVLKIDKMSMDVLSDHYFKYPENFGTK